MNSNRFLKAATAKRQSFSAPEDRMRAGGNQQRIKENRAKGPVLESDNSNYEQLTKSPCTESLAHSAPFQTNQQHRPTPLTNQEKECLGA